MRKVGAMAMEPARKVTAERMTLSQGPSIVLTSHDARSGVVHWCRAFSVDEALQASDEIARLLKVAR